MLEVSIGTATACSCLCISFPCSSPSALLPPSHVLYLWRGSGGGCDASNAEAEKWQVCFKIVVLWIMEKKIRHTLWKWKVLFLFLETILMQVCQREETHGLLVLNDLWVPSYLPSYYFSSCPIGDPHSHPLQVYEEGVKIRYIERETEGGANIYFRYFVRQMTNYDKLIFPSGLVWIFS